MKKEEKTLRKDLVKLIEGRGAHADFNKTVEDIPLKMCGATIPEAPHTLWELLEHMRLSQRDIIDYIKNPDYTEGEWPEDYWPKKRAPEDSKAWKKSVDQFLKDRKEVLALIEDEDVDLLASVPYVKGGPSILNEILLIADHTSYHLGQMVLLRRLLGIW